MMRRLLFGFILAVIAVSAVAQMLWQPSAESDALFAAGVDLYNEEKYREAIPLFAKSDSLDKVQIDSTSNRRDYSSMWLASCYYKTGDTATAAGIDANYRFAPVDRRLTVKSDSLSQIGMEYYNQGDYAKATDYLTQCAAIEKSVLGDSSVWYCNSLWNIGDCYYQTGDLNNALKYNEEYLKEVRNIYGILSQKDVISTANLGLLYHQLSLCDSALNCLIYAYDHLDSLDLNKQYLAYHIANEYNIIASEDSTANKIDLLQQARSYLQKADVNDSIVHQLHTDVEKNIALCLSAEALKQARKGDYKEALSISEEVVSIFEKAFGKDNLYYAVSLASLANNAFLLEEYDKAIQLNKEALHIIEGLIGNQNYYYALLLSNLAKCYAVYGIYSEALQFGTEAVAVIEKAFGKESADYARLLENLAECYAAIGNFAEAARLEQTALSIYERTLGKDHLDYASSIGDLCSYNSLSGNHQEAIRLGIEYVNICEKMLGKEHQQYVSALGVLAQCYHNMGNYAESMQIESEALEICTKVLGKENYLYATILYFLAIDNANIANYSEAIRLEKEVLQIYGQEFGKNHPNYVRALINLTGFYLDMGKYSEAVHLGTQSLELCAEVFGKEHRQYASALSTFAQCQYKIGNYSQSIRLMTEALHISEKISGKYNVESISLLGNLAEYNAALDNYSEAIRLVTKALELCAKGKGKEHPEFSTLLGNLANYHASLGNYKESMRLNTEALQIDEKVLGKEHPDYAKTLISLSAVNAYLGNYKIAIKFIAEGLKIIENSLGRKHPLYVESLGSLTELYATIKRYDEAVRFGNEVLKRVESIMGKNHPKYAMSLRNFAKNNAYLGNYAEAKQLSIEALEIFSKTLGKNNIDYFMTLNNLAIINWKIRSSDVGKYCVEATEALSGIVRRTFADLTARERNTFWDKYKAWFEGTIHAIAYDMPSDSLAENGYNGALMAKGLLLNSEMELSTLLKESGDEEVAGIYNDLKNLRLQINKLYEMPVTERPLDADSLERVAQGLERQLVQRSKAYGDYTANLVIDWKQVRQRLSGGEMAVEFVSFPLRNDSVMYAAYCLRKDMPSPKMVPLFEERQLTSMDKRLYLSSPMLYNLIWKPLEKEMKGVTTVYFAPSGELYNLPIENLPIDGSTYNSDLRSYRRLSSTRQLALRRDGVEVEKAAVYGGLKYDTDTVTLANDSHKYRTAEPVQWSSRAVADSLNLRDGVYELPATKIEAEDIDKALESAKIDTELYTDTIGTEASFKALSGSVVNALHIATHGFYWTEREVSRLDNLAFLNDDMPAAVQEDKALTRSGLLLAGANTALKGLPLPEGVEDGVLTAKEIAGMDLRRLDLVALSACQTGLGEVTGDGVFGLQRGFKKAGANTLLMSLWKVDDTATQLLMTQFYKNMLSGMGKYEALTAAQKYLRELEVEVKPEKTAFQQIMDGKDGKKEKNPGSRTVRKYANPYYWAAFVLLDGVD